MNPDHCFVATASESGEQDAREKEMEENMNEVSIIRMTIMSKGSHRFTKGGVNWISYLLFRYGNYHKISGKILIRIS